MSLTFRGLLLFACVLSAAPGAFTQVLYNNVNTTVEAFASVRAHNGLYNGFTSGSQPETLTTLQLNLALLDTAAGSVSVGLYAEATHEIDAIASPRTPAAPHTAPEGVIVGSLLTTCGTIQDSAVDFDGGVYTVSCNYALSPKTKYFIGLTTSDGSNIGWAWNTESDSSASGIDTSGQYHCYGDESFCQLNGLVDPFLMSVSGSAASGVPALSPWAFGALALLMLAVPFCLRRRALDNPR